jgi:hypothetical protein
VLYACVTGSLHYHFIGSYVSSGTGTTTSGNLEVRAFVLGGGEDRGVVDSR